jgi:hypothetical protein
MAQKDAPPHPMTLGDMRNRHGVHELFVTCSACGSYAKVNVDAWPDDLPVLSFSPRMGCRLRQAGRDGEAELAGLFAVAA